MPTYLYECDNCGRFEEFQSITEDSLENCPECGESVKKIIGAPGIIFKGSGFYSTDNEGGSAVTQNGSKENNEGANNADKKVKTKGDEKAS
ncbi:MAG: FmdB family transcriptional regulator [Halanaerobiales bacterium]|nr:FmdB family transcriptional regulator [Halanaerobiales bacterium]